MPTRPQKRPLLRQHSYPATGRPHRLKRAFPVARTVCLAAFIEAPDVTREPAAEAFPDFALCNSEESGEVPLIPQLKLEVTRRR